MKPAFLSQYRQKQAQSVPYDSLIPYEQRKVRLKQQTKTDHMHGAHQSVLGALPDWIEIVLPIAFLELAFLLPYAFPRVEFLD